MSRSSFALSIALASSTVLSLRLARAEEPLKVVTDVRNVTVLAGDRPIVRYRYADVPFKPYVDQFFTPAGINILRDSPHDHKHHHGLMFAVSVDGVNFWEETPTAGHQEDSGVCATSVKGKEQQSQAGTVQYIAWVRGGERFLDERRSIQAYKAADLNTSLITWTSDLRPAKGRDKVTLSGSPYFGLGMRFVTDMDKGGSLSNAEGKTGAAGTNAVASKWCAYTAKVGDKEVTVAMFDHPANPRQPQEPATWFTMDQPFAYVAATLDLSKRPVEVTGERPMVLKYGVALWDGRTAPEQIEKVYKRWVELDRVNLSSQPAE